eukprot:SM000041S15540  [mRNA]  locus=s41:771976:774268:+ [translate_table: standard]
MDPRAPAGALTAVPAPAGPLPPACKAAEGWPLRERDPWRAAHKSGTALAPAPLALQLLLAATVLVSCASLILVGPDVVLRNANHLGRSYCRLHARDRPGADGATAYDSATELPRLRIAIVSCADDSQGARSKQNFDGLMQLTGATKESYAKRHGYTFIDASDVIDHSRPASWSKIKAVLAHLREYDIVFWTDADSLVANHDVSLQEVLLFATGGRNLDNLPDLILTADMSGVNAGMFFLRNTTWSHEFLEHWWNQTSYVLPFGLSKSGDNDALKSLISDMPPEDLRQHVAISPAQCAFNSYPWVVNMKNYVRLMRWSHFLWRGAYSRGDFMIHLAGLNDKRKYALGVLQGLRQHHLYPPMSYARKLL